MAKKFGLGNGLDALMGDSHLSDVAKADISPTDIFAEPKKNTYTSNSAVKLPEGIECDENGQLWVKTSLLKPNPQQPRTEFDEEKLNELADSIREHGVVQSITIEDAGDGSFYIIAGERRTRAARMAGVDRMPVQLRRYNEQKKLEVALIENIQRADLNPIEEARAYYKLMEIGGLSQDQVAFRVGKKRSTVANAIRLLKLPEDMQNALAQLKISAGHARALLSVNDNTDQRLLFGKIIGDGMSVREAESSASALNGGLRSKNKNKPVPEKSSDPDFAAIQQKFMDILGTKVTLKGTMDRGSLVIDFFSRNDLTRLYDIITGSQES